MNALPNAKVLRSAFIKSILRAREELESKISCLDNVINHQTIYTRKDGTVSVRVFDNYNNGVSLTLEPSDFNALLFNERQAVQLELDKINLKLSAIGALLGSNNELS